MRKIWKYLLGALILIPLLGFIGLWYWSASNTAQPTEQALAALKSDAAVSIVQGDWLVFQPAAGATNRGVIVYPGANCDIRGYAPVLRELAAAGYTVVSVPMPFSLAVLAPNTATDIRAAYPDIDQWVIIGHSMGGAMAGYYAYNNTDALEGVIFWDSYPPEPNDLSGTDLEVWHIHRATLEGEAPEKFQEMARLFPADATWVPIKGGIHMYFGSFDGGGYVELWEPKISRDEQLKLVTDATLAALKKMFGQAQAEPSEG